MSSPIVIQGRTKREVAEAEGITPSAVRAIEAAGWLPVYPPHLTVQHTPVQPWVYWTVVFEATPEDVPR